MDIYPKYKYHLSENERDHDHEQEHDHENDHDHENERDQENENKDDNKDERDHDQQDQEDQEEYKTMLLNKMALTNGWNDRNEKIIITLGENSASYKWMHEHSSRYYKYRHNYTSVIFIILNTVLTVDTVMPSDTTDLVTNIIRKVIIYIVTILSIMQIFLKSEETSEKHLNSSAAFSELYHDIQQKMCMYRRDRINANKYVALCLKKYDSIVINSPDIPSSILKDFKKTFNTEINFDIGFSSIRQQSINDIENGGNIGIRQIDNKTCNNLENNCNLSQIHSAYQISGELSDADIEMLNVKELRDIKKRYLESKSKYEFTRFLEHTEND